MLDLQNKRICVTGGAGFLGRAVCTCLRKAGVAQPFVPRSGEFDLTCSDAVARLFDAARPDIVIHLAAEVGGIGANARKPGRFFYANMAMGLHLIEEARKRAAEKFVQVGTVCSYPKLCPTPFQEDDLWNGFPEETNAPYGIAKRTLGVMLDAYRREHGLNGIYLIPVNLYGPGDDFDPENSHVIPAMIRRFCEAQQHGERVVTCWGSGQVSREFLFVEDAAEAIVAATSTYNESQPVNLGSGREIRICELAGLIARLCGYVGRIRWDKSRPDGQPRRCLDTSRGESLLRWRAHTGLEEGLQRTIHWWKDMANNRSLGAADSKKPMSVRAPNTA